MMRTMGKAHTVAKLGSLGMEPVEDARNRLHTLHDRTTHFAGMLEHW